MMIVCALFEIAKAQVQFYKADGTRNRTGMNHIGVNNIELLQLEIIKWATLNGFVRDIRKRGRKNYVW